MNIRDNIQNILAKISNNEVEFAVIFKSVKEENGSIAYTPIGITTGKLDMDNMSFTSKKRKFSHLVKGPKDYGFAFCRTLTDSIRGNRLVPPIMQKRTLLKSLSNFYYVYTRDQHDNPIVGVQAKGNEGDVNILYEEELLNFYLKWFPKAKEIIQLLKKASGKLNLDIQDIFKALEDNFSNKAQAREILTAIWKHYHYNKSYHIFVNGSDISPKKEIITSICECANIPYYYVKAFDNYELFDLQKMLKDLLKKCNNNQASAEQVVLIIDDIDKLALTSASAEAFVNAQLALTKLLSGKKIELTIGKHKKAGRKIKFDTSKMMIIGMGDFRDDALKMAKVTGFSSSGKMPNDPKDKYKYGMLEGLFNYFYMIIQMDEPNVLDYQNALTNREEAGVVSNTLFFENLGVKLSISEELISKFAKYAYDKHLSLNDIKELVERMLADASYVVAENPDEYSELIVEEGIIGDNKKYVLERRKKQDEKKDD